MELSHKFLNYQSVRRGSGFDVLSRLPVVELSNKSLNYQSVRRDCGFVCFSRLPVGGSVG